MSVTDHITALPDNWQWDQSCILARIVETCFIGEPTVFHTAHHRKLSGTTVKRKWVLAQQVLCHEIDATKT